MVLSYDYRDTDRVYRSCGFLIDQLGDLAVKIPYKDQATYYISGVQIKLEKATFLVAFNPESKEFPPYRIENFTMASLLVGQKVFYLDCNTSNSCRLWVSNKLFSLTKPYPTHGTNQRSLRSWLGN
jgi:hypothetical protein